MINEDITSVEQWLRIQAMRADAIDEQWATARAIDAFKQMREIVEAVAASHVVRPLHGEVEFETNIDVTTLIVKARALLGKL